MVPKGVPETRITVSFISRIKVFQ